MSKLGLRVIVGVAAIAVCVAVWLGAEVQRNSAIDHADRVAAAEQMLTSIGVEVSATGVGLDYGARSAGGVLDGWLVDERDAAQVERLTAAGIACDAVPLMMTDHDATAAMAAAAIALVR